ncbi:MAG: DUF4290 domain-containing protein [Flavobacteriaceae bacterium]|nr:DUF4290 domain-containing protein [Flavobacteriaceae bacterium]MCY4266522.1 DUF4290 domain-containing protein [Flavobacteriaceae bacterium]
MENITLDIEKPQYNTQRKNLTISEYGRHIQKMIDQIVAIKDPEVRMHKSHGIIQVMGNLNPHLRDIKQFHHKLWHHLIIMSDFQLKPPFPNLEPRETLNSEMQKLPYPTKTHKYRYYGNNVKRMIEIAKTWDDSELKDFLVYSIANHMKKNYLIWNRDSVEDHVILEHLKELSQGELSLDQKYSQLSSTEILLKARGKDQRSKQTQITKRRKKKIKFKRHS